ncbi:aldo/keto reductase [Paenibacillus eucommiae]|uniref:Aryl-alcohol dehydrogenase-like predicted oxidoreductase n=1 Tax=Paenibacillus eucommiae TaxID=1355755 RepID=A0ABS4J5Q7_9BACL|nr:aldo/keto reductase [Paenibacillus eucommiae]MBP1995162.1 aryl-alcohol dehydrogenase-like predicted oxidoreductase [Paenibacillus eucommiae]
MQLKPVTGTDLLCSTFCLGGASLGSRLNLEESFRLMDAYAERGGNFIDTAQVYANWLPAIEASISEKTIGLWMKARKNRNQMLVSTKGGHPLLESMQLSRMSQKDIAQDIEGSLRHLQVDTIDLYILHRDDTNRPVQDILETLNEQVKAGRIRYFGCSNWTVERIIEAQDYAKAEGIQGFSGNQMMWSLAEADQTQFSDPTLIAMDNDMKQYHIASGVSAFPYSSQAQGLFTKWDSGEYSLDDKRISPMYSTAANRARFERAQELASELSLTITEIVLGYLISQPFHTFPIIGCRTHAQLEASLKAEYLKLTQDQLAFLG